MIYTCPKCGKKIDLSTEVLINSDYKVICPQCLSQLQIVGDYAYIPDESLNLDTTVQPSHTINCPKCGHEAKSNAHFCPNCGTSFDTSSSATTAIDIAPEDVTVIPPPLPNSDPLYNEAVQFLMGCTAITPMMLRDRFHISDERAAELIRQLEAGGIIGPYNNGGPRQILIPHRRLYDYTQPQDTLQGDNNSGQSQPQPRRIGCFTWLLITMILIFLMKACGL
ncbi:MAG: zinc ribbon domain-containing protein [Muribaculaceae bacterium]|nr:zinc ribbon domain-containing protein [Muribaculaceae bacterium]